MIFQYDRKWVQWKMSFLLEDYALLVPDSSASAQPRHHTKEGDRVRNIRLGQQLNLFADHWRLKKLPVQGSSSTVAAKSLEKATSSGRSYGDAQTVDGSEHHPSHIMISLL